jgi:hypothetical protein
VEADGQRKVIQEGEKEDAMEETVVYTSSCVVSDEGVEGRSRGGGDIEGETVCSCCKAGLELEAKADMNHALEQSPSSMRSL